MHGSIACGRLCLEAERLGIPAVTGMHEENPGSDLYRPEHVFIIATEASAVGIHPVLERMAEGSIGSLGKIRNGSSGLNESTG